MDANKYIAFTCDVTMDQREMGFLIQAAHVTDRLKFAKPGTYLARGVALDESFGLHAVANEIGNRNHLEAVEAAEFQELSGAGHRPIGIHDFANHAARRQTGEARQVNRSFGLAGPYYDSTGPRA
jgi:hypothetical protein